MSAKDTMNLDEMLSAFYREEEGATSRGVREDAPSIPRLVDGLTANDFGEEEKRRIAASSWAQMIVAGLWEESAPAIGYYIDFHKGDDTFRGAIERLAERDPWEARRVQDAGELVAETAEVAVLEDYFALAASGQKARLSYEKRIGDLTIIVQFEGDELAPLLVVVRSAIPDHEGMTPSVLLEGVEDNAGARLAIDDMPPISKRTLVGVAEPTLESSWLSPGTFYDAMSNFQVKKFIASVRLSVPSQEFRGES